MARVAVVSRPGVDSRPVQLRILAALFTVAFALRLALVAHSRGGFLGNYGYDAAVYYSAADSLLQGRLPYRDFVLVHPPALMLALTPFAGLGRLIGDQTGFVLGNLAFTALGAVNASLVVRVAQRFGLSRAAALLGGGFYAVWFGAVDAEISMRLEPLGGFALLLALGALATPGGRSRRWPVAAGAALGVAVSVKIWWILPLLVVLCWQLVVQRAAVRACLIAAGSLLAFAIIDLPFLVRSPAAMWHLIVSEQFARPQAASSRWGRLDTLSSLRAADPHWRATSLQTAFVILVVVVLIAMIVASAWQVRQCRLVVVIAATQLLALMAVPLYNFYYSDYLAGPAALVVAAASDGRGRYSAARAGRSAAVTCLGTAVSITAVALVRSSSIVTPFPARQLRAAVTHVHCLMADSPMALIALNRLSTDLDNGCRNWVDVTARTYGADAGPASLHGARSVNQKWQRDIRGYLLSGDAVVVIRSITGLSAETKKAIDAKPVLGSADGYTVYAVPHDAVTR